MCGETAASIKNELSTGDAPILSLVTVTRHLLSPATQPTTMPINQPSNQIKYAALYFVGNDI